MAKARSLAGENMKPAEAKAMVDDLYQKMFQRVEEKVKGGRFMRHLGSGTLAMEAIKIFWLNWHGFVSEINNFIACTYQRHGWFFKRHLDLLAPFADKVADELIHPKPPGHIQVVLEQGRIFGLTDEEMIEYLMLPECRALLEWHRGLLYEGTMAEWWTAIAWEEAVGHWAKDFREALMGKYGFTTKQAPYFHTHEEADLEVHEGGVLAHGAFNRAVLQRVLEAGHGETRTAMTLEYCAVTSVDYFAMFLDGAYKATQPGA